MLYLIIYLLKLLFRVTISERTVVAPSVHFL